MSICTGTDASFPSWLQQEFKVQTATELDDLLDSMEEIAPDKSELDD